MADYQIAAYYFPNYHVDPRNEAVHGPAWTEWELVKNARPRFAGHDQPKVPLWGYEDESSPVAFARKIDAAADHGITSFIFDWYWYNDGPFLQRGLEQGYLGAANADRVKFALMWANHDWVDIHPAKRGVPAPLMYPGKVTPQTFETVADYVIEKYFRHPSYWRVNGRPYFSIYELFRLVEGFGGVAQTAEALARFRAKCERAGVGGVHLNAVVWGVKILPGEQALASPSAMLEAMGFDSVSSYVWVHHVPLNQFPQTPYESVAAAAQQHWQRAAAEFHVPFFPNVTMGWDASPRTVQSDVFTASGYPFMSMMSGNTPQQFERALLRAKDFLTSRGGPRILSLNAWNEWTEGSYLEPDTKNGYGYLEAVKRVFG